MEPTHSLHVDHEVPWSESLRADKRGHLPVDVRPVRLHQVVDQRLPPRPTDVQVTNVRIEPNLGDGDAYLA